MNSSASSDPIHEDLEVGVPSRALKVIKTVSRDRSKDPKTPSEAAALQAIADAAVAKATREAAEAVAAQQAADAAIAAAEAAVASS